MKIAIIGVNGQLGTALRHVLTRHTLIPLDLPEFDITKPTSTQQLVSLKPDVVIHTAAMTNVDDCAKNPQLARLVNSFGTQNVALACLHSGAEMVYISTNEVFDGKTDEPYHEYASRNPINPYAESKFYGEEVVRHLLSKWYIVRIAWLFTKKENNFPAKIIRAADKLGRLKVVTDEVGNPTYAPDCAEAIKKLIATHHYGMYHFTNSGYCSRYDFAIEILRQTGRGHVPVEAITSDFFERVSVPPKFSPLVNNCGIALEITLRSWQEALHDYLKSFD
ncbi:MAG: dTDP-4-dehydrorhamnose reductase [Anaerolineaceae bacterium 4572_78]|nr:MAG: dTDP-4-dehydrorhamnose reductase [Anaerolineaceae bacterium 4572_78]